MIYTRYIGHKYHLWYFKVVSNFTLLTAREITYNNIISKYHSWYLCQTWLQIMLLYTYTNFTNRKNPAKPNYHIMSRSWTSRLWDFYIMFLLGASLLMFVTIFVIFSLVRNFTNFTLSMHHFMINYPQNRLVWSGSQHMIVWFMGFFLFVKFTENIGLPVI